MRVAICFIFMGGMLCEAFTVGQSPLHAPLLSKSARTMAADPSFFESIPNNIQALQHAFSSLTLSDAAIDASSSILDPAMVADPAAVVEATTNTVPLDTAYTNNGWFGFLTGPTLFLLQGIHAALVALGMETNAWGFSIIALVLVVRFVTFPLTKAQLENSKKMQKMQPAIQEIQSEYKGNPQVLHKKMGELYATNKMYPWAGTIQSIVQIPVFIGLYRAISAMTQSGELNEPFLWLPNLEGPDFGVDGAKGSSWLFSGWSHGVPSLGWEHTLAFLSLPILLMISQYVSLELTTPQTDEKGKNQQSGLMLKLMPLMMGYFSLNVPPALCLYWVTNNILTTATTVRIRNSMDINGVSESQTPKLDFLSPRDTDMAGGVTPSLLPATGEAELMSVASAGDFAGESVVQTDSLKKSRKEKKKKKRRRQR